MFGKLGTGSKERISGSIPLFYFYFPNGRYIDYLSLTQATNKTKILKVHYKYYEYYKQNSR